MSTSDGSTNAPEQRDGKGLSAETNLLDRGLGGQFNITVIAALLSLVVTLVTLMITTRVAAENTLEELRRDQERQAIIRLEIAQLREIDATIAVVTGGLPAKFTVQQHIGIKAASKKVSDATARIGHAASLEEAQRYHPGLREARQEAIALMHEALRNSVS